MGDLARFWPDSLSAHTDLRARLIARYDDARRGYHDLLHLEEVLTRCIELLDAAPADRETEAMRRDAVLLAAWFHDAVYEGTGGDEERSASLAEDELSGAGPDSETIAEVARLVRLTARHRPADDDPAGQILSDADLAILAADPERYRAYTQGVRSEYAEVSEAHFRRGRAAVLRDLLAKPTLFHTAHARDNWETAARENVRRELAELESSD